MANNIKITCVVSCILHLVIGLISSAGTVYGSSIGVCCGIHSDKLPSPNEIVSMYNSHHIKSMRLYEPDPSMLQALHHSGIRILVGANNRDVKCLGKSYREAQKWFERNIQPHYLNVDFKYIAIGNEAVLGEHTEFVIPAMRNLHNVLRKYRLQHRIKISTVVSINVLGETHPPSSGFFSNESMQVMGPILRFLNRTGAPLLANIHPYFSYTKDPQHISLSYALFRGSKDEIVMDGDFEYSNLFDEMIDTFYVALEKMGRTQISIVVSETGWPAGSNKASFDSAQMYHSNLVKHLQSSNGTPRRRGAVETYLYAMFQENKRRVMASRGSWGLFFPNKMPVYSLHFK